MGELEAGFLAVNANFACGTIVGLRLVDSMQAWGCKLR